MTRKRLEFALLIALGAFLVVAPVVLPMVADQFWVGILTEILIWSLLAASVNLLFGYVGLLSFGQALYFGMGMYGVAIGIAKLGLGFWGGLAFGCTLAVAMSAVAGIFAVRLTWHYFAIITVVFSLIFYFLAMTLKPLTGGDDGTSFTPPPMLVLGDSEYGVADPTIQYFFILSAVALCYALKAMIIRSAFGRALIAIRENDRRAELIGLNVYWLRLQAFIFAGFLAGMSGALYALFGRYASASYMFYHVSGEAVVWAIIGGAGTLLGPLFGTGLLILVREELSSVWEHYPLLVGVIAIAVVIFAPKGLVGLWNTWVSASVESTMRPAPRSEDIAAEKRA